MQARLKEELLAAYFLRAENVADHDVLLAAAASVGIDEVAAKEVLAGDAYADAVEHDIREARRSAPPGCRSSSSTGSTASPAPSRSRSSPRCSSAPGTDAHPALDVVGGDDACGPDGCAV